MLPTISSAQSPHVASDYRTGHQSYRTFPSSQEVRLDGTGLDS